LNATVTEHDDLLAMTAAQVVEAMLKSPDTKGAPRTWSLKPVLLRVISRVLDAPTLVSGKTADNERLLAYAAPPIPLRGIAAPSRAKDAEYAPPEVGTNPMVTLQEPPAGTLVQSDDTGNAAAPGPDAEGTAKLAGAALVLVNMTTCGTEVWAPTAVAGNDTDDGGGFEKEKASLTSGTGVAPPGEAPPTPSLTAAPESVTTWLPPEVESTS
jgi:hypothetical protein